MIRYVRMIVLLLFAMVAAVAWRLSHAEPPPGSTGELAPFYQSLRVPDGEGAMCCSVADCRPVVTRFRAGALEALIGPQFPDSPNDWRTIPEKAVIRGVWNQAGEPVLCYYNHEIRCFLDGGSS